MTLYDITFSKASHNMDRGNVGSVVDIVFRQSLHLPLITSGGGGGGFSVLSSPIIKTIKVGR